MATGSQVPKLLRPGNALITTLLRAGIKVGASWAPICLLTVRGRKSGLPRTTPIAVPEQDGQRYLMSPYGVVDWVRNLRAAGEATLTRGRHAEHVRAIELPVSEAVLVLKKLMARDSRMGLFFKLTAESSPEEFERVAMGHPVFSLQNMTPAHN